MSETISRGGFSRASAYCRNWLNAASRLASLPLYSQAKWWRFHTSAQPSPPVSLRAPRSKQYQSPAMSASVGDGSPSKRQRSLKCDCAAERSFSSDARHLAMNSLGVIDPVHFAHPVRAADQLAPLNDARARAPSTASTRESCGKCKPTDRMSSSARGAHRRPVGRIGRRRLANSTRRTFPSED